MATRESSSGWVYGLLGCVTGIGIGIVLAAMAEQEQRQKGVASRILEKIPRRIKVAGAVGAVKGAGGEAYREIKHKAGETFGREEEKTFGEQNL